MQKISPQLLVLLCIFMALLLAGCQGSAAETQAPTAQPAASATPAATQQAVSTPTPLQAATPSTQPDPTHPVGTPASSPEAHPTDTPTQTGSQSTPPTPASPSPAAPTSPPSAASPEGSAESCLDLAGFYGDLSIPDDTFFYQDTPFTKSWRIKNEGSCTWDAGYAVIFNSGDPLSAPLTSPLPRSVPPGSTVDIALDMRAPDAGGSYYSNWELQNSSGDRFGLGKASKDFFWTRIKVGFLPSGEPVAGTSQGSPGAGGPAGSGENATAGSCAYTSPPGYAQEAIQYINQARLANGLPALAENPLLDAAALAHSIDMACNNHSSHTGTDGSSWPDRIAAQGYAAALALENVYAGDPTFGGTPRGAVDWWLGSPVHLANILNPNVTEIGVGYAASESAEYKGRFTAVFARP